MKIDDDLRFINHKRNYSQLSTSSTMSENSRPTFLYQRRRGKKRKSFFDVLTLQTFGSEDASTVDVNRTFNACNATENCSSDTDDANECSSSGALDSAKEISQRDIALLVLKNQESLNEALTRQGGAAAESNGVSRNTDTDRKTSCKVCERIGSTLNMLICDNCEDAFHVSCYNPRMTILPVNEWLCTSCSKKKRKIPKGKSTSNVASVHTENDRNHSLSEFDLGSLEFMFRDTEPYMSNVKIGDEFQADVPVWRGPVDKESDLAGETVEFDPSNNNTAQELASTKIKLGSIGNWLQCREVIEGIGEGVDGTICGKWRRAPLFEVQTDNWECFRSVIWDPVHADCAVPQEIDTKEVMKQLKYIEMLRPRLAPKGRKSDTTKSNGSQDESGKDKQGDMMKKSAKHVRSSLA